MTPHSGIPCPYDCRCEHCMPELYYTCCGGQKEYGHFPRCSIAPLTVDQLDVLQRSAEERIRGGSQCPVIKAFPAVVEEVKAARKLLHHLLETLKAVKNS